MKKTMTVLCVLCIAALAAPAWGAIIQWEGDVSKDWFTGGNWAGGSYPTSANDDYGEFKNATGDYCEIANGNADARSIWVGVAGGASGRLDILSTGTLTTQSWFPVNLNEGELNLYGNFAVGGTLNMGAAGGAFTVTHHGGALTTAGYDAYLKAGGTLKVVGDAGSVAFAKWGTTYTQKTGGILEPLVGSAGLKTITSLGNNSGVVATVFESDSLLKPGFADGVTPYEDTWTVMNCKNHYTPSLSVDDQGLVFAPGVDSNWSFEWVDASNGGKDLEITYVPEPATMALLGIGGIGVLIRRRRK